MAPPLPPKAVLPIKSPVKFFTVEFEYKFIAPPPAALLAIKFAFTDSISAPFAKIAPPLFVDLFAIKLPPTVPISPKVVIAPKLLEVLAIKSPLIELT